MRATDAFAGARTELARRLFDISLTRWTGRPALDTPLSDLDAVADALIAWRDPR